MRSKRLFAILLAFCLVFSNLAPAASAVEAPADSIVNAEQNTTEGVETNKSEASPFENDLLVSGQDTGSQEIANVRDNPIPKVEEQASESVENEWVVTPADAPDTSLLVSEVPDSIEELKEAAEIYSAEDVVTAFVVMEDAPLAESYNNRSLVSASLEKALIQKQDAVISSIERTVLKGEKLNVRYQFTYLTNSFSIETEFANLEKIANLSGVKSVFIMPIYTPCTTANPNTASSGAMTGVDTVWEDLGYTGAGMKIAIIDTGLDLDHPSFAAAPELTDASMTAADIAAVLENLNAYNLMGGDLAATDLYRSPKVPYAFNYVDGNLNADHTRDAQGDHGTHVAGIAAANAVEGTTVVGMAPDAQIIVMKVFGANGGAYADDIVAALEDAMILGCDVVNGSLGSPAGFASSDTELDLIYERLATQNIIATFSAGNEGTSSYGNLWGTDLNTTSNPDNATVGSPSSWVNTFSIASAENAEVMTNYFSLADGTKIFYMDSIEYLYGETYACMAGLEGQELEYVFVPNLGAVEDFYDAEGNSIVEGKVAIVLRGDLSFSEKAFNAQNAGAAACIIWNHNDEDDIFNFGMTTATEDGQIPSIPVCLITLSDGNIMQAAETKTLAPTSELAARMAEGGQMSSFSSWGVTPDLQIGPDITGIGGNVFSTLDGGVYGLMSGTSMSAPQIAGISALVMQYLYEVYPDAAEGEISELAMALMMSTADPIIDSSTGLEASPRQQGAGLVNAADAVNAKAYLTVNGGLPKAELGDNTSGVYVVNFEIHNISDEDMTYSVNGRILSEAIADYGVGVYFMAESETELDGNVYFDSGEDTVTVAAGETKKVTVAISLSAEAKEYFNTYWENGGYVEGFLYLTNEEGEYSLNLPFLGFYGDWTDAPVFDSAYWYENSFWGLAPANGLSDGNEYYHVMWTDLAGTDWVLGFNPYSGALEDANGNIIYDPANNVISPNGDGVLDGISEMYISLMRNAKVMTFTYTVDGEVVHRESYTNNSKTMYISAYGQVVPWLYSWYGEGMYDFAGLENGTEVLLTIDAQVDYGNGGNNVIEIPITVDTQAPELVRVYELPQANDRDLLFVELKDNVSPATVVLMNTSGTRILGQSYDTDFENTGNGTYIVGFDITGMGSEFMVVLGDYAANESYYNVTYTADPDGNLPEMDTDLLYAYRVNDATIEYYMGYDYMFGWVSMNKPEDASDDGYVWIQPESSDYMEYYALSAAEYAGGKIFAVDAGYNFLVLDPGLWNRHTICNLGVAALDMAFDDTTDTMYLLAKNGNYVYLYSVDLLTGELTELKYYGYQNYSPWAITVADDGTIYAVKYNASNYSKCYLYTLDKDNGYAMTVVTNAAGEDVVFTGADGNPLKPNYAQSLTYSDGMIYWGYFYGNYYGNTAQMISIDTANDFAYTATDLYSVYPELGGTAPSDTEMVGLLTLDETEYVLPEATALESIWLDSESLVMGIGETAEVAVNPVPWNFKLTDLEWSSDNEAVATVVDGVITAVGEGNATITVKAGEATAECLVTVVNLDGSFYAYNYFSSSGYGDMFHYDMETGAYEVLAMAPVDFLAGEYNGHDGYFYGYTEGGQFWRYDLETGECVALGAPTGVTPADMAYDYSSGMMYAITLDYMSGMSSVCGVNLKNGELVAMGDALMLMTLACDLEGNLYSVNAEGNLYKITFGEYGLETETLMSGLGNLQYMQSMCYDYENGVLLWANPETVNLYWIDFANEVPYALPCGDPSGSGMFEYIGMFNIPAEIPELEDVAVESFTAEDMMILTGNTKYPSYAVMPLNATCQAVTWTSSDETVVKVNADGSLTGVADGTAVVTGVLNDTVSGEAYEVSINVTVMTAVDNMYGHVLTDMATYAGYFWTELDPGDTSTYTYLAETSYTIYAEEYYNGKLYAYGYDAYDWEANWQMFVMDPETFEILEQYDVGEGFPFVYDMTYDYSTSTMYAVAGVGSTASDLYIVNTNTGALIPFMATEQFFMSLAAGPDGKLYAMEQSGMEMNWETYMVDYTPAKLYTIDPVAQEVELVGSTGVKSNMLSSMSYDYDTGKLYWTSFFQDQMMGTSSSGLCIVDPETAQAMNMGVIGTAGAQVSGVFILCDEFPEEADQLNNLLLTPTSAMISVGGTTTLDALTLPMNLDAEVVWTSSDASVATVDGGVVTGVSQGAATITASVTYGDVTKTASCNIVVLNADAGFLTYNVTDGSWASISRHDQTVVTNLSEGVEGAEVNAVVSIGADVYGVDVENNFFKLDTTTYERTVIGTMSVELDTASGYDSFEIVDLEYDVANDRLLALGNMYNSVEGEMYNGRSIYEVNLEDGALTELFNFGYDIYIMAMAVAEDGTIYYYSCYDDMTYTLDLETGTYQALVSLQTQTIYGDYESDQSMYYDALTDTIYMIVTGNGNYYRMLTIDPVLGTLTLVGNVGEVVSYMGDYFAGLTFVAETEEAEPEPEVKDGIVEDEDGVLRYYVDGVLTYAGLIQIDGDYYYVRSSGQLAVNTTYWVTKTNDLLPADDYYFGADGKMVLKNGIVEENGVLYYYVNNVKTYAGLIQIDGAYYYVRSSGQLAVNTTYWITKTNDLLPAGNYTFGADGKLVMKNGVVLDDDGEIRYYVNDVAQYAGLVQDDEGNYYYINSSKKAIKDRTYWVTKTNDLLPAGNYTFGADGKMVNPPVAE